MSNDDLPPGAFLLPKKTATPDDLPPGAMLIEDKYKTAAKEEQAQLPKPGAVSDYTRRLTQGLGMNWTDEAVAGLMTGPEMLKRGTIDPREAYNYAKARENLILEGARERTGKLGSAVEVLGGLATGGRAVLGGALPAAGQAIRQAPGAWNAVGRYFGNVGKAGLVGAAGGAGEGDTLGERAVGGAIGGGLGLGIGAAAPAVINTVRWAAQPITNQLRRFAPSNVTAPITNVDDIATAQIAKTIDRSGKTPNQIAQEVADANASGQPYVLAEGIGVEGQRKLAGIAKSPGRARAEIDEALSDRDLGRGLRAQEAVDRGLGMPHGRTAEEVTQALTQYGQRASRPLYQAAEQVQPVWSPRMQEFFEHPEYQKALREGFHVERTRALAEGRQFNPRDYAITQFDEAGDPIMSAVPNMRTIDLMKKGVDQILNKQRNPLTGKIDTNDPYVRALQQSQQAMLREVDSLNPAYGQARAAYAGPAQVRSAVERGQNIPAAGRPQDTIRRFEAQNPLEQQGSRFGLADAVAERIAKGTETGPLPAYLRSPKGRQELDWMSLHQGPRAPRDPANLSRGFHPEPINRALEREKAMRATFQQARGGSQTAENLADMADNLPPAPDYAGVFGNLFSGNFLGAAKAVIPAAGRGVRGDTEAQRLAMTRLLMQRDPAEIAAIMQRVNDLQTRQAAAATARAGAGADAASDTMTPDQKRKLRRILITKD